MMKMRDWYYIEARLVAPGSEASEAIARLKTAGEAEAAKRLTEALATFMDECRAVRHELASKQWST